VRAEPPREGRVRVFFGGALRCLADSASPSPKKEVKLAWLGDKARKEKTKKKYQRQTTELKIRTRGQQKRTWNGVK
jgi:hypothetical protein